MHFENILFIHLCQGTGFYVQIVRELNKKLQLELLNIEND